MYWAMRTDRYERGYIREELNKGKLRQGWGWTDDQNLRLIHDKWDKGSPLSETQIEAGRHYRMYDGPKDEYMNIGDIVLVPNLPGDGFFTLCEIIGDYGFNRSGRHSGYGHIRPVKILVQGVPNNHNLVSGDLRKTLRCRSRLWRIAHCSESLERIIECGSDYDFGDGTTTTWTDAAESVIAHVISNSIEDMTKLLSESLPIQLQGAEWEPVIEAALRNLFSVTVRGTGGPGEKGADIEVTISNPFEDDQDWILPIQVKDYQHEIGSGVVHQLEQAYVSRKERGHVIAVALLVTEAEPTSDLEDELKNLSDKYSVPFLYCGKDKLMRVLSKGFIKQDEGTGLVRQVS